MAEECQTRRICKGFFLSFFPYFRYCTRTAVRDHFRNRQINHAAQVYDMPLFLWIEEVELSHNGDYRQHNDG